MSNTVQAQPPTGQLAELSLPHCWVKSLESLKGLKGNEYRKAWNKLFKEKCKEARRAWAKRNPEKVKANFEKLKAHPSFVKESKEKKEHYYRGSDSAKMKNRIWDDVDDCLIMERKMKDRDISEKIGRSIMAIQIRRCRLTQQNFSLPTNKDHP